MAIRPIIYKPAVYEPTVSAKDKAFDAQLKERQMLAFPGNSQPRVSQTTSRLSSGSNSSGSEAPIMSAFLTQRLFANANGMQTVPVKLDGRVDQGQAQADRVVADVIRGKSIDLIAKQTLPHVKDSQAAREQILDQLRAAGLRVDATENNIGRTTAIADPTTGKTVTETHDLEKGNYTIEVKSRDGNVVSSSPLRDGLGRKQASSRDEKTGAITTRYENDMGDGTVVERTSRPDGSAIEKTTHKDGKTEAWFISSTGHRIRLAGERSVAERNGDQVKKAVFEDGATIAQVARNRRMTESEVIALLKSGGVRIETTEPTSDNGDTRMIKIVDPATNKMVIEGYDYQHDEPYRRVIDGNDVFDVKVLDPNTGDTTRMKMVGAAGYAQKHANDQHSTVNGYESRIRQLGTLIQQARKEGEPTAGLEKERTQLRATLEKAKVDEGVAQGGATSILAATQQAETGKIVGEAYERLQKTKPGTASHERAKDILEEILGFADRVDRNVHAADKNLRLLEAGQDWLEKETVRAQAHEDLQKAFQQFKKSWQWNGLDDATIRQKERAGERPFNPYRNEQEENAAIWKNFQKSRELDYSSYQPVWRAYEQASDAALRARIDLGNAAIAKTAADLHFLQGETIHLRSLEQAWVKAHPNQDPAKSPFQKLLQETQGRTGAVADHRKKLVDDPSFKHDNNLLHLPAEQRHDPEKRKEAEVGFVREDPQANSAEIQALQAKVGGPITGRDSARVRAMIRTMVQGMGEAGREVDVKKVETQILRSPQINGDDPDNAGDLTVRPIVMRYDAPGVSITTGLFEVENRQGETHYVDMAGKVFDSRQDFLDNNNQFKEEGILVMPTRLDTTRRPDGTIAYEAVKAQYDSAWEKWGDPIVGIGTAVATIASFTPAAPVAAPLAYAGGAYLGGRALVGQVNHLEHGGSWGDKESRMNMLSIATTALPLAAGGVRTGGLLARTELPASQAAKGGFGAIRTKDATLGVGKVRVHLPKTSYADDVGRQLQSGGKLNAAARGMDGAAIVAGVPLIRESAEQLAANGGEMSGLELANSVVGLGTGIAGTGLGVRGLRTSRSPTAGSAQREASSPNQRPQYSGLEPPQRGGTIDLAIRGEKHTVRVLGPRPQNPARVYVPPEIGLRPTADTLYSQGYTHELVMRQGSEPGIVPIVGGSSRLLGPKIDEAAFEQARNQAAALLPDRAALTGRLEEARNEGYRFGVSTGRDPKTGSRNGIDPKNRVITIDRRYASDPVKFLRSLGTQLSRVPDLPYWPGGRPPSELVGEIKHGKYTRSGPSERTVLVRGDTRAPGHFNAFAEPFRPPGTFQGSRLTASDALDFSRGTYEGELGGVPASEVPWVARQFAGGTATKDKGSGYVYVFKDPTQGSSRDLNAETVSYKINDVAHDLGKEVWLSFEHEHMLSQIPPEYIIGRRPVENGRFVGEFEYNPNAVWRIDVGIDPAGETISVRVEEVRGSLPESPDAVFVPEKAGYTDRFARDVSGKPRFTHELIRDQVTRKYFIQPIVTEASE
ncbi:MULTISPECIES: DUF4781 domain-containing protein [unclassified Mesorhizobium]|uniref:DUF4781 domain-containing protein n=1 Tax=unclassified Mesorhizobium TaxID=325217 RepID=UPI000FD1A3F9|nr:MULTISPECIES: DUF4781 domain-containing protein [unclassified Mesorhizobium]RVB80629.1 DUF4781 domain-containing protein [Mesorhizobium sp. M6A.T.Cr.TU.014.01.1.1]RWQ06487.1 MAG: DUF4781 domain-containing protein [Mesorhizobium sp.]RWQ10784.1 MAG: DUF4781 domain-containing protein [Mesorhizobium sp.]